MPQSSIINQPGRRQNGTCLDWGFLSTFSAARDSSSSTKSITNYNRTKLGEHPEIKKAITESIKDPMARSQAAGIVCDRVRKSQC
jgi:hypothetical protein